MACYLYLGSTLLPVTPAKVEMKIAGANKTLNLINEGEVNQIKTSKLTEISFEALLPGARYPFAVYEGGVFREARYYLEILEDLKKRTQPFQFKFTRTKPDLTPLYDTNLNVTLEKYTIKEDAKEGQDVVADITLKEYRPYSTKVLIVKPDTSIAKTEPAPPAEPLTTSYTVKKGDNLWAIAKRLMGSSSRWKEIYTLNESVIEAAAKKYGRKSSSNGWWIYPGTQLKIPGK